MQKSERFLHGVFLCPDTGEISTKRCGRTCSLLRSASSAVTPSPVAVSPIAALTTSAPSWTGSSARRTRKTASRPIGLGAWLGTEGGDDASCRQGRPASPLLNIHKRSCRTYSAMSASRKPLCIPICHSLTDNWTNKKGGKKSRLNFCLSAANSAANLFLRGGHTPAATPLSQSSLSALAPCKRQQKSGQPLQLTACFCCGAPEEIRTPGLQVRSLLLYPAELRARREKLCIAIALPCQILSAKK